MKVNNPRHPHKCTVYRIIGEDSFSDGEKVILYEGICRKEGSTNLRTFKTDNVIKSDYLLSLPGIVEGILAGDLIDVTDRQGTFTQCMVTDRLCRKFGNNCVFQSCKKLTHG